MEIMPTRNRALQFSFDAFESDILKYVFREKIWLMVCANKANEVPPSDTEITQSDQVIITIKNVSYLINELDSYAGRTSDILAEASKEENYDETSHDYLAERYFTGNQARGLSEEIVKRMFDLTVADLDFSN